jgi:membrane-associated protease RseP (regulator of RpoE activity)
MNLFDGLLIFFTIIFLYSIIVFFLHRKGYFEKFNISFFGPALMLRTTRGRGFLQKLAEKKRFWKAFGSSGVVICFIFMIAMVFLLIWQVWTVAGFTPEQVEQLPGIEFMVIIPGINPILPLEYIWYILFALIIAIIVHEFSHGILTLVGKLKVKSLGILYMIVPLGAFCEPDEEELKKTKLSKRMRIYAAGPTSNLFVVLITILIFSFILMSSVQLSAEGAVVFSVDKNSPAEEIGLTAGSTIISFNNSEVTTYSDYVILINNTRSNQTVEITYLQEERSINKQVELKDRYIEWGKRPDVYLYNNESLRGKGYLGVPSFLRDDIKDEHLAILKNPFRNFPDGFLFFFVLPLLGYFQGYNPITHPFNDAYVITGLLQGIPSNIFWGLVNFIYWIFWLNLAVALFNVLPMVPLDGGFLFNDALRSLIKRIKKGITEEQREKLVKNVTLVISLVILILIMFPWLVKYFY